MKQRLRQLTAATMAAVMSMGLVLFAPSLRADEASSGVSFVEYDATHYEALPRLEPEREMAVREALKTADQKICRGKLSFVVSANMGSVDISGTLDQNGSDEQGVNLNVDVKAPGFLPEGSGSVAVEVYKVLSAEDPKKIDIYTRANGSVGDEIKEVNKTQVEKDEIDAILGKGSDGPHPFDSEILEFYSKSQENDVDVVTMLIPIEGLLDMAKEIDEKQSEGNGLAEKSEEVEEVLAKIRETGNIQTLVLPIDLHINHENQIVGVEADWTNLVALILSAFKDDPDVATVASMLVVNKLSFSVKYEMLNEVKIEVPADLLAAVDEAK